MSYVDLSGYKIPKKMFDELNPFERHKLMMSLRSLEEEKKKENKNEKYLSDYDILRKKYNFIHDVENEKNSLLQNYYKSICNKYVICDLSKYKETKIGLRWRTEEEIIKGKGHVICSSKKCNNTDLNTYEFLFQYIEQGIKKETNVKVRACMDCAYKLHYRKINKYLKKKEKEKKKKKIKEKKKRKKKKGKKNKSDLTSESDLSSSYNSEDRSQSKREKLYYVKKKLEKISIKKKEEMNEDNLFFHDLLF
ncbi:hypothetical protein PFMG_02361 [Plasmodium falciparum IGH-CR14]|uniref:Protein FRA10AC1 n=7 Tax=Plasmodium falciparum TaxID=5833 RepID=A0A143ZVL3_PLAF7|nr:conserved protein, unknown function [Plasmodium falciparum 3D7]ETW37241.1 hypothetical protein PFTANZ_02077 [Plasmodium falciparum Tanzania (2000708)]ETW43570.1 hypothetical protein PFNF135_02107 [Plasmodium falciparum NF135/5.C10]EUR73153.1 hypothetical protein PFBG_02015 [Plasmodium falciparum 7G8]KAF4330228.1 hypothetical protein CYL21_1292 [Plasmodium falciparum NF54]KNG76070.1 hypothetical protein PFMG_02361 [Plasmodium falciparum IGH-CR14]|eukprot:XP_024329061.1 conserved protein, unknown function [Plasmodium falciparum 3D7]